MRMSALPKPTFRSFHVGSLEEWQDIPANMLDFLPTSFPTHDDLYSPKKDRKTRKNKKIPHFNSFLHKIFSTAKYIHYFCTQISPKGQYIKRV